MCASHINLRRRIGNTDASDIHIKIVVVEGAIFSESEPSKKEETAEREERCQDPTFVMAIAGQFLILQIQDLLISPRGKMRNVQILPHVKRAG